MIWMAIKGSPEWKKAHSCNACGANCWNAGAKEPGDTCWEPASQSKPKEKPDMIGIAAYRKVCRERDALRKLLDAVVHAPAYDGRHPKGDPIILDDLHPDTRDEVEAALKGMKR